MNQRHVELSVTGRIDGKGINVRVPADGTLAPPGYYMLFVIDAAGTPSVARWIRLGMDAPDAPELAPDADLEPAPDPAPSATPSSPRAAPDTHSPRLRLLWPAVRPRTRVLRPGLRVDEAARGHLTIRAAGLTLRRSADLRAGRTLRFAIRLPQALDERLLAGQRVRFAIVADAVDAAGNRTRLTRRSRSRP